MRVLYYDIVTKLPLGNAKPCATLEELLKASDYVTMHVPKTDQTNNMIAEPQIKMMKPGTIFMNASRGTVVDIPALSAALRSGHLGGCAVDVYPTEPEINSNGFLTELQNCPNTILTPHIGGSTEEAQGAIGIDVANKLTKLINEGSTTGAVNFPDIELPSSGVGTHRILNTHQNVPGVLKNINSVLACVNVSGQILRTRNLVGYIIIDVDAEASEDIKHEIAALSSSIKTRILY